MEAELVGRDTQLRDLHAAVADAAAGRARVAVVSGRPGSGKTALLDAAIGAAPLGTLVLRASGHPAESDLPHAGLHQLLGPVADRVLAMPGPRDLARALAFEEGTPRDGTAVAHDLLRLVTGESEHRPVLLVIDDAQWLDGSSRQALVFLARRVDADAVCIWLGTRPEGLATVADLGPVIELPGLDAGESRELLRDRYPALTAGVVDQLVERAAGLPLALVEMPAEITDAQRTGAAELPRRVSLGRKLDRLYERRLAGLGAAAREALLLVSLEELGADELRHTLALAGRSTTDLEPAEREGLVDLDGGRCRFTHPTLGVAVQNTATTEQLRAAHRAIAEVLADQPLRSAPHLHESAVAPDEEAERALVAAAEEAERRGGHAEAGRFWEAAARHTADPADRRGYWTSGAMHHLRVGAGGPALGLLDRLVAEARDDVERASWHRLRIVTAVWADGAVPEDADELLRIADRLLGNRSADDASVAVDLLTSIATCYLVAGQYRAGRRLTGLVRKHVDPALLPLGSALVVDILDVISGVSGAGDVLRSDWIDRVPSEALGDPGFPVGHAGVCLGWMDELDACEQVVRRLERELEAHPDLVAARIARRMLAGLVHDRRGNWDRAELELAAAERAAIDSDFTAPYAFIALRRAYLLAARGQVAQSAALRALAVERGFRHLPGHFAACVEGMEHLTAGRYQDAVDALERADGMEREMGSVVSGYTSRFVDWFEAMWHLGRATETEPALVEFEAAAAGTRHPTDLATAARCRALLAEDVDLDERFASAVDLHRRSPNVFESARTLLLWGQRLRRCRRKGDAIVRLQAARELFQQLGAQVWIDAADSELAACGRRRTDASAARGPLAMLTPREFEVAQAVATGLSNAEAAHRLVISLRTVEYHLSNAYRKLGVADRHGLADLF